MEGVRAACHASRNGELDGGVRREVVHAAGRQEVVCVQRSVQDLQEHGDGWGYEGSVVDEELRAVLI